MRAWIEIRPSVISGYQAYAALLVRAWIEIMKRMPVAVPVTAALLVRAWIEMATVTHCIA